MFICAASLKNVNNISFILHKISGLQNTAPIKRAAPTLFTLKFGPNISTGSHHRHFPHLNSIPSKKKKTPTLTHNCTKTLLLTFCCVALGGQPTTSALLSAPASCHSFEPLISEVQPAHRHYPVFPESFVVRSLPPDWMPDARRD